MIDKISKYIPLTESEIKKIKKVLVVQTAFIGDVILITPLIRAIRQVFSNSSIDVMVIPQTVNVLENNPHINSLILFDKRRNKVFSFFKTLNKIRKEKYDIALTPHSSITTALLMFISGIPIRVGFKRWTAQLLLTYKLPHLKNRQKIEKNLHLLSPFTDKELSIQTEVYPSEGTLTRMENELSDLKNNTYKLIAVAPGSNWFTKRWPLEYYGELVNKLIDSNYGIVFIGSKEERNLCNQIKPQKNSINMAGELSLLESAAAINLCDLIICNDSGAMHLANAVKTDVFAFFGPTVKKIGYFPIGKNDYVFEVDLDCRPCSSHGTAECPLGHHNCMRFISSDSVFQKVNEKFGMR